MLKVNEVQAEGKKRMTSDAFLRGSRLEKGWNSENIRLRIGGKYEQALYLSLFIRQIDKAGIINLPLSQN